MLKGIAASEGIGIGKVVTIRQQKVTYEQRQVADPDQHISQVQCQLPPQHRIPSGRLWAGGWHHLRAHPSVDHLLVGLPGDR